MAGRTWAAVFLGFPASVAILAVLLMVAPGPLPVRTLPLLLLFFPIWVGVSSGAFLCRTGAAAFAWLGSITVVGFGALHTATALGWVELAP